MKIVNHCSSRHLILGAARRWTGHMLGAGTHYNYSGQLIKRKKRRERQRGERETYRKKVRVFKRGCALWRYSIVSLQYLSDWEGRKGYEMVERERHTHREREKKKGKRV